MVRARSCRSFCRPAPRLSAPSGAATPLRPIPAAFLALLLGGPAAAGQRPPPAPPVPLTLADPAQQDLLQRILDAAGGRVGPREAVPGAAAPPGAVTLAPPGLVLAPQAAPPAPSQAPPARPLPAAAPEEPLSPAEAFHAAREPAAPPLRQIGYEALRGGGSMPAGLGFGALPEDYVLGRDDELLISFRGRVRQTMTLRVGRDGLLAIPDMPPVPAAGLTLGALRADLEARAAAEFGGSEAFVSVAQVRQIAVFVGGEVARPGLLAVTAHASVLDALAAAGGVRRTGSLRAVRVEGGVGRPPRRLDLYPVLAGTDGPMPDLSLREGERILVPPLGATAAVGGGVTRPGIYELPAGAATLPVPALLALAGQPLRPEGNRLMMLGTDAEGRRALQEVGPRDTVRRGDALRVEPGTEAAANDLRLAGHVVAPVRRAALAPPSGREPGAARSLRQVLADPLLVRPDPYPLLGLVWRTDRRSRVRSFLPFDLAAVLRGQADLPLAEGDEVILPAMADIAWLASPAVQQAIRGEAPPSAGEAPAPGCPALLRLAIAARSAPTRFAHARGAGFPDLGAAPCPQLFLDYPALLAVLLDQSAALSGEVRAPGLYPLLPGTPPAALLEAAGGPTPGADLAAAELAREAAGGGAGEGGPLRLGRAVLDLRRGRGLPGLQPRDALRIPPAEGERDLGPITLVGEFLRPGTYEIRRGERLSEAIARAGGLTPQAYPYGAVLTRESVRQRQQEGFQRSARELELGLTQVATGQAVSSPFRGGANIDLGGVIAAGRGLAEAMRQTRAAGRMVVEADPVVLAARPELDVLLEPGDLLAMPKRPGEVTVVGAVLNPGSLQFVGGWRAADYVRAAGGQQRFADGGRAFLVLPNGQSAPGGLTWFRDGGPPVPPGSVVVVPQDPSPFEFWGLLRDATVSQLAVSAAAIAVIARSGGAR